MLEIEVEHSRYYYYRNDCNVLNIPPFVQVIVSENEVVPLFTKMTIMTFDLIIKYLNFDNVNSHGLHIFAKYRFISNNLDMFSHLNLDQ